jgi:hypothetical protein
MGEYAFVDGKSYKMGTCESLYYVTLPRLQEWRKDGRIKRDGGETAPSDWDNGSYRFRFPFPDEDTADLQAVSDYERDLVINVTRFPELADLEHYSMTHSCHSKGGGYNINVFHPCPQDEKIKDYKTSDTGARIIGIRAQKPVDGEVWTVISCPYCGAMARLPWEDAVKVVVVVRQYADDAEKRGDKGKSWYYHEIADRIAAGYTKRS